MKILIWISRIFVGGLFIFSGLIKANDSVGFSYKLQEYFEVFASKAQFKLDMHSSWLPDWLLELFVWKFHLLHDIALPLAMFIVVFEIVLGVCTITGTKMKWVATSMLVMIVFFTFLTFVSWQFKIVTGCGCFGDAIKLTPFESFIKDLILLVFILVLFFYRKSIFSLFDIGGDRMTFGISLLCSTLFVIYTYKHLPFIDFRAYAVGNDLKKEMIRVDPIYENWYVMKNVKTGEEKKFKDYPMDADTWKYSSLDQVVIKPGIEPKITDFVIYDEEGTDVLQTVLNDSGYTFFLVMHDLSELGEFEKEGKVAIGFTPDSDTKDDFIQINEFAKLAEKEGMKFSGLTASGVDLIGSFRHQMQAAYPFYGSDGVVLKTIIRSNPGLILLKNGVVLGQWHINDFPDFEDLMEKLNINYAKEL
ncbi:MAG: DoxX family membrane protein [Bacteroidetes bacterium]|nr:DoxX family membrane protein [Bacteroidota bacterium]